MRVSFGERRATQSETIQGEVRDYVEGGGAPVIRLSTGTSDVLIKVPSNEAPTLR